MVSQLPLMKNVYPISFFFFFPLTFTSPVYDPYTAERRGNRTRTAFPSPISRRTVVYHRHGVGDDDDDGQTSTTTYTNTQSMPRKAGSAESRSRTSEWALEGWLLLATHTSEFVN